MSMYLSMEAEMQKEFVLMLVAVLISFVGIIIVDLTVENGLWNREKPVTNWQWGDDWNSPAEQLVPKQEPKNEPKPEKKPEEKPKPEPKKELIVARNYGEALTIAGQREMPIVAYFEADWCHFCREMKAETLSNEQVKEMLKNYVFVYVNADKEKAVVRQFGVGPIPAYVITNADQAKLKMGQGKLDAQTFIQWLNEPNLFKQPKKEIQVIQVKTGRIIYRWLSFPY